MVFGEGVAVAAEGVGELWGYNRDNFLYDRTMRQETELKVAEWKREQAGQWREDIEDLTGLTEKKMDIFLVVNTLQLGMCVALYTEGRLQPGTPHWLLHLYVVTLTAAFMYLLMSVWLSIHASIAAACERARLRTQHVRLPIPTWEQFNQMRTTAASFEKIQRGRMMRVPFLDTVMERPTGSSTDDLSAEPGGNAPVEETHPHAKHLPANAVGLPRVEAAPAPPRAPGGHTDTWGLEDEGKDIPELSDRPLHENQHIRDVRAAQANYQCYDAFARVSMTFGTNQLLFAIAYYCIGYISVGDGAPYPAGLLAVVMVFTAIKVVELDISFQRQEGAYGLICMVTGPICVLLSTIAWCSRPRWPMVIALLIPPAYVSHGLWLLWALKACQVSLHPNGQMLPTMFRTVMYIDVFGWIHKPKEKKRTPSLSSLDGDYMAMTASGRHTYSPVASPMSAVRESHPLTGEQLKALGSEALLAFRSDRQSQLASGVRSALNSWRAQSRLQKLDEDTQSRIESLALRLSSVGEVLSPAKPIPECLPALRGLQRERTESSEETTALPRPMSLLSESVLHRRDSFDARQQETLTPGRAVGRWQKMKYYTECGDEVPYMYDPETGQVRHMDDKALEESPFPVFDGDLGTLERELSARDCPSECELESLSAAEEEMFELENICRQEMRLVSREHSLLSEATVVADSREKVDLKPRIDTEWLPRWRVLGQAMAKQDTVENYRRMFFHTVAKALPWLFADEDEKCEEDYPQPSSRNLTRATPKLEELQRDSGPPSCRARTGREMKQCLKPGDASEIEHVQDQDHAKLPWKVFRYGTLVLVLEWMLSPFMLYGLVGGITEFGPRMINEVGGPRSFAEREDPDGTFAGLMENKYAYASSEYANVEPTVEAYGHFDLLDGGQRVSVQWPRQSTFAPRSFSSDISGNHIVVSDDFSLYTGRIVNGYDGIVRVQEPSQTLVKSRQLRGPFDLSTSFASVPHCSALEGQVLKDVGVVCSNANAATSNCRVLVLHADGHLLTECPLVADASDNLDMAATSDGPERMLDLATGPAARPAGYWKISGQWLDPENETVESVAVNDACGIHDNEEKAASAGRAFDPDEVGCVLVGTSSGRVVQLRRHATKDDQLVPEWAIQERLGNIAPGTIHVYPGGYVVMLRKEISLMQAFDSGKGSLLGQWRLPKAIAWQSLTGGGDSLFMLGRDRKDDNSVDDEIKMWRFALPAKLKEAFDSRDARK